MQVNEGANDTGQLPALLAGKQRIPDGGIGWMS
jgi:hypothetical protein